MVHGYRAFGDPARRQRKHQTVAVDCRFVGHDLVQVQDDARAIVGLNDIRALQIALVECLAGSAETVRRVREIERDPRRLGNAERRGKGFQGLLEGELDVEHLALLHDVHRLDRVCSGVLCAGCPERQ